MTQTTDNTETPTWPLTYWTAQNALRDRLHAWLSILTGFIIGMVTSALVVVIFALLGR